MTTLHIKSKENLAAFASISATEWTRRAKIDCDVSALLQWVRGGFLIRRKPPDRKAYKTWEYKRVVEVPPLTPPKGRVKVRRTVAHLPPVESPIWEPRKKHISASDADLRNWQQACARLRDLPTMLGVG